MKLFAFYDRDYYCQDHINSILTDLESELTSVHIHDRKEIENYLLNIEVIERVLDKQIANKNKRSDSKVVKLCGVSNYIEEITNAEKNAIQSQYIGRRIEWMKNNKLDVSTVSLQAIESFEILWTQLNSRMTIVPGKSVLKKLRDKVQSDYGVTLTDFQIIDEFKPYEIPGDLKQLIEKLEVFRSI